MRMLGCYSVVWWVISMCCKKVIGRLFMKVFHFVDQHWLPQRWNHDGLTSRVTHETSTGKERDEKKTQVVSACIDEVAQRLIFHWNSLGFQIEACSDGD
jgi:hypothetical protein